MTTFDMTTFDMTMCQVYVTSKCVMSFDTTAMYTQLRKNKLRHYEICVCVKQHDVFGGYTYLAYRNEMYTQPPNAIHCNTLQHTATHCSTMRYTATHCNTLQHTATHCNTLQHTATHATSKCVMSNVYMSHV